MNTKTIVIAAATLLLAVVAFQAHAQKGMGDSEGIARQAAKPKIVSVAGTVLEVKTERCELATGRSDLGTHVLLKTSDGKELNIHIGPEADVAHIRTCSRAPGTTFAHLPGSLIVMTRPTRQST